MFYTNRMNRIITVNDAYDLPPQGIRQASKIQFKEILLDSGEWIRYKGVGGGGCIRYTAVNGREFSQVRDENTRDIVGYVQI